MADIFDRIHTEAKPAAGDIFAQLHAEKQVGEKKPDQVATGETFLGQVGKGVVGAAETAASVIRATRNPIGAFPGVEKAINDQVRTTGKHLMDAYKAAKEGRGSDAYRSSVSAIPLIGEAITSTADKVSGTPATYDKGGNVIESGNAPNYGAAGGDLAVMAGGIFAPKVAAKIPGALRNAAPKVADAVGKAGKAASKAAVKVADALPAGIDPLDVAAVTALAYDHPLLATAQAARMGGKAFMANRAAKAAAKTAPSAPAPATPVPAAGQAWNSSGGGTLGAMSKSSKPIAAPLPNGYAPLSQIGKPAPPVIEPPPPVAAPPVRTAPAPVAEAPAPIDAAAVEAPPVAAEPLPPYEPPPKLGGLDAATTAQIEDAIAFRKVNANAPFNGPEFREWKVKQAAPAPENIETAEPLRLDDALPAAAEPAAAPASVPPAPPLEPPIAPEAPMTTLGRALGGVETPPAKLLPSEVGAAKMAQAQARKVDKTVEALKEANIDGDIIEFLRKPTAASEAQWAKIEKAAGVDAGRIENRAARRAAVLDRIEAEGPPSLEEQMRRSVAAVKARKLALVPAKAAR